MFLNDLEDHFKNLAGCPLEIVKEKLEANLHIFIEIFVLLYADDTVIFSESKEGMQSALNIFQSYCDKWKLTVKVNKTKVLVFSRRKCQQNFDFTLNGENLDVTDSYTYLGITFKYNGSFVDARKRLVEHAPGADPGFQVRGGGALKKIAPSRGRRENFRGISCEKSLFYAKKS